MPGIGRGRHLSSLPPGNDDGSREPVHRLVYPSPKTAIVFFVTLKLIALVVGFTFFYYAILALVAVSFAGAVYEYSKFLMSRKASPEAA